MVEKSIFKEIGTKSVVEQIVDSIVNAIIEGELKPGDKIPTETELCNSMNVGRNSVREAIKILKNSGHFDKKLKILCLNTIHNRNFAQYVAHDLIQNGLNVEIEIYNLDKFLNKLKSKDYDIALYNITINSVYPLTSLEKTIVGELIDYDLEDSLLPFFNLFKEEIRSIKKKEMIKLSN